jgi:hypothetical protein
MELRGIFGFSYWGEEMKKRLILSSMVDLFVICTAPSHRLRLQPEAELPHST